MTTHPKPNLFDWATSELSQDAFLSWLMNWADPQYQSVDPNLYHCAVQFIRSLLKDNHHLEIKTIKVERQWKHIDVLVTINDNIVIVIEDKTFTSEHSDQLTRYTEEVKAKFSTAHIHKIYFKMHEQSNYHAVIKEAFRPYTRQEMLSVLNEYITLPSSERKNDIVVDFHLYLTNLENKINRYLTTKLDDWNKRYYWQGFYTALQKEFNDGDWGYVNNPSGGFMGYWWHTKPSTINNIKYHLYLQLKEKRLVARIYVDPADKKQRNQIRYALQDILFNEAKRHSTSLKKYGRYGNYMAIALFQEGYLQTYNESLLDLPATIQCLKKAMTLLDTVYQRALTEI